MLQALYNLTSVLPASPILIVSSRYIPSDTNWQETRSETTATVEPTSKIKVSQGVWVTVTRCTRIKLSRADSTRSNSEVESDAPCVHRAPKLTKPHTSGLMEPLPHKTVDVGKNTTSAWDGLHEFGSQVECSMRPHGPHMLSQCHLSTAGKPVRCNTLIRRRVSRSGDSGHIRIDEGLTNDYAAG